MAADRALKGSWGRQLEKQSLQGESLKVAQQPQADQRWTWGVSHGREQGMRLQPWLHEGG